MDQINGLAKASFLKAYLIVKKLEGGYVSPATAASIGDKGGETYKGVARNFNPNWAGWKIIDAYKAKNSLKWNQVINDPELDQLVKNLFKKNYWDVLYLDNLNNQTLANLIFDYSINGGQGAASSAIQKALNIPVTKGKYITPLSIDKINKSIAPKAIFDSIKAERIADINRRKDSFDKQLIARAESFFFREG